MGFFVGFSIYVIRELNKLVNKFKIKNQ